MYHWSFRQQPKRHIAGTQKCNKKIQPRFQVLWRTHALLFVFMKTEVLKIVNSFEHGDEFLISFILTKILQIHIIISLLLDNAINIFQVGIIKFELSKSILAGMVVFKIFHDVEEVLYYISLFSYWNSWYNFGSILSYIIN